MRMLNALFDRKQATLIRLLTTSEMQSDPLTKGRVFEILKDMEEFTNEATLEARAIAVLTSVVIAAGAGASAEASFELSRALSNYCSESSADDLALSYLIILNKLKESGKIRFIGLEFSLFKKFVSSILRGPAPHEFSRIHKVDYLGYLMRFFPKAEEVDLCIVEALIHLLTNGNSDRSSLLLSNYRRVLKTTLAEAEANARIDQLLIKITERFVHLRNQNSAMYKAIGRLVQKELRATVKVQSIKAVLLGDVYCYPDNLLNPELVLRGVREECFGAIELKQIAGSGALTILKRIILEKLAACDLDPLREAFDITTPLGKFFNGGFALYSEEFLNDLINAKNHFARGPDQEAQFKKIVLILNTTFCAGEYTLSLFFGTALSAQNLLKYIDLLIDLAKVIGPDLVLEALEFISSFRNLGLQLLMNHDRVKGRPTQLELIKYIELLEVIARRNPELIMRIQSLFEPVRGSKIGGFFEHLYLKREAGSGSRLLLDKISSGAIDRILLRIIRNNFLSPSELKKVVGIKNRLKTVLIDEVMTLSLDGRKTEAVSLLTDALDPRGAVGSFFHLPECFDSNPSLDRGELNAIFNLLNEIDPRAAEAIKLNYFLNRRMAEQSARINAGCEGVELKDCSKMRVCPVNTTSEYDYQRLFRASRSAAAALDLEDDALLDAGGDISVSPANAGAGR